VAEFSLKDILIWREEEMITTEMIALAQSKPYFVVPRKNPIDTIYKLMFQDHLKKAYLSFPITKVLDKPNVLEEIRKFRETLAKHLTVFDPYTIQEKRLLLKMKEAEQANQQEIEVDTLDAKLRFKIKDLKSIERDIDGQIISRDFNLINQSDMIVALIPEVKGEADISAGVQSEIQYAHDLPRDVYVIWPSEEEPSVWVNAMATEVFTGVKAFEEALEFMKKESIIG
jgi:nucleoside 2-deoxyribosyltransferase